MPSLAQGYGRGLLLGLQFEEAKRQRKSQELLDEYRREQLADIRWGREKEKKSFLAQIKTEEETAKQEKLITDIATMDALGRMSGESFMKSLLIGERTPPETKERLTSIMDYVPGLSSEEQFKRIRVGEKVEGAPGVRPWYETYLGGEEMRGAAKVAGGLEPKEFKKGAYERQLLEADPSELTEGQERYLKGLGYWYDPQSRTWLKKANLPPELLEAIKREGLEDHVLTPSGTAVEMPEGLKDLDLSGFGKGEVGTIPEEETFHGAESYEDVVEAVGNIPEPKRSQILKEAKAFFGIE